MYHLLYHRYVCSLGWASRAISLAYARKRICAFPVAAAFSAFELRESSTFLTLVAEQDLLRTLPLLRPSTSAFAALTRSLAIALLHCRDLPRGTIEEEFGTCFGISVELFGNCLVVGDGVVCWFIDL